MGQTEVRYEINHEGLMVQSKTSLSNQLGDLVKNLFSQYGWKYKELEKHSAYRKVELTNTSHEKIELNLFTANIRNEKRSPYEKKIQLNKEDPRMYRDSIALILGFYVFEENDSIQDAIIVGYPIDEKVNYDTNPSIRGVFVNDTLLEAKNKGLYFDRARKIVAFRPEFIFYYLDNYKSFHGYTTEDDVENKGGLQSTPTVDKPHQRIFFGAPGTGKSYKLNREAKEFFGENYERVTFHPSYMYGNFVGAFKPYPKKLEKNGELEETITYEYVEGIFMRQLVKALSDSNTNYLLIIEEINRANVAAVFGDIFQLLDRDETGASEYKISTSKDQRLFLEKANEEIGEDSLKSKLGESLETLYLPSNFYIWATMNSADQGVMPMDTAFRRRWDFTYLGIDEAVNENKEDFNNYRIKVSSNETALWNDFRVAINKKLAAMNIPEDKFIGPYFISRSVLENSDLDQLTNIVKDKVIMYLYEDVAKGRRNELFEENKHSTYSQTCSNFEKDAKNLFKGGLNLDTLVVNDEDDKSLEVETKVENE